MFLSILIVVFSICSISQGTFEVGLDSESLVRHKRQLLFPNSTVFQLTIGATVPTPIKTIVTNWGLQANFNLPWNRTQIPLDILHANDGITVDSRNLRRDIRDPDHVMNHNKDPSIVQSGKEEKNKHKEANKRKNKEVKEAENKIKPQDIRIEYANDDAKLSHFYKFIEQGVTNGFGDNGTACVLQMLCQLNQEDLHTDDDEDLLHEIVGFLMNPLNDVNNDDQIDDTHHSYHYIEAYRNGERDQDCEDLYSGCSTSLVDIITKKYR